MGVKLQFKINNDINIVRMGDGIRLKNHLKTANLEREVAVLSGKMACDERDNQDMKNVNTACLERGLFTQMR